MQVDNLNYNSKCAKEVAIYYDIQRNIALDFSSTVKYDRGHS